MTIRHHPSEASLIAHASGTLGEGLSVVVASHLALCQRCRDHLRAAEDIGGALVEALPPSALSPGGREAMLARLDATPREAGVAPPLPRARGVPRPLADYLDVDLESVPWRAMAPGVRRYPLVTARSGHGTLRLLRIAPGTALPRHEHQGHEFTLVLKGSFSDDLGRYRPGDLADLDSSRGHQPIADADEDCVCLIATDAPLRFKTLLPRLAQPFLGM